MKKLRNQHILSRGESFIITWQTLAPDAVFSGMTLEQFKAAVAKAREARREVDRLMVALSGLRHTRNKEDLALAEVLMSIAYGVRGDPTFGPNSPFFSALGFVTDDENRRGRPRKPRK